MSDAFYNELLVDIKEILEELGTNYTVRSRKQEFNTTSMKKEGSTTTRTALGLVSEAHQGNAASQILAAVQGASNWFGKRCLILSPDALPLEEEEVSVDGRWFNMSNIETIKPANVTLLYILELVR